MWFFNKQWAIKYTTSRTFNNMELFTIVKARNMAHAVRKLERRYQGYVVNLFSIEKIKRGQNNYVRK